MTGSAACLARGTALLDWYRAEARSFPWRGESDPYRVLVSEVMLQQTQATRVIPYYEEFLERFPDVETLAAASLDSVLSVWSGLGYNSRAKRLRNAARVIAAGGWPTTPKGLVALPGVGPYTAAAIACFAFGADVAAPDTNARRVLSRWRGTALEGTALKEASLQELTGPAAAWNQAIMDLGATVCLPTSPRCGSCPVAAWCPGPDGYSPPRPQAAFGGSNRQARGAAIRHLLEAGTATLADLSDAAGIEADRIATALAGLVADGMVVESGGGQYALAGD